MPKCDFQNFAFISIGRTLYSCIGIRDCYCNSVDKIHCISCECAIFMIFETKSLGLSSISITLTKIMNRFVVDADRKYKRLLLVDRLVNARWYAGHRCVSCIS